MMASDRNMPNRGIASMDVDKQRDIARKGRERVLDEKRNFSKDHVLATEPGRNGSREFPMRSEASHEILNSPRMLAARAVDRRAAISPTTMRWGSFAYFAF
jgi:general stress protein YciG